VSQGSGQVFVPCKEVFGSMPARWDFIPSFPCQVLQRETESDVGLLPVPVLQLIGSFSSSSVKATSAESEKGEITCPAVTIGRSIQGTLTSWLSSVA